MMKLTYHNFRGPEWLSEQRCSGLQTSTRPYWGLKALVDPPLYDFPFETWYNWVKKGLGSWMASSEVGIKHWFSLKPQSPITFHCPFSLLKPQTFLHLLGSGFDHCAVKPNAGIDAGGDFHPANGCLPVYHPQSLGSWGSSHFWPVAFKFRACHYDSRSEHCYENSQNSVRPTIKTLL